ncbi:MAG: ferrous iron transport protein A [Candidatus Gallimonas sp.]
MTLSDLNRGDRAVVMRTDVTPALRERLRALNVFPNSKISVLKVSIFRKTFLIAAGSVKVAIRREVASAIRVFPL